MPKEDKTDFLHLCYLILPYGLLWLAYIPTYLCIAYSGVAPLNFFLNLKHSEMTYIFRELFILSASSVKSISLNPTCHCLVS